jgi:PAS domain S-box-containing protein
MVVLGWNNEAVGVWPERRAYSWSICLVSSQAQPSNGGPRRGRTGSLLLLSAFLAAAVFALDLMIPLGIAGGVPYVTVLLVFLWTPGRHDVVVAAAACSLLILLGYLFSPPGGEEVAPIFFWQAITNRVLALLAVWVTALLVLRRKQDLRQREQQLQDQMAVLVELTRSKTLGRGDLQAALREITEAAARVLQTARVGIWLFDKDGSRLRCVEQYERDLGVHGSGPELEAEQYPAYFAALETHRTIAAGDATRDPRTCEFRAAYLEPLGIAAMLDAPIRLGGRLVGVVCHEHIGRPRRWSIEERNFAGSVADFVDLAMEASERQRAEDQLRRHHDQLEELVQERTAELTRLNRQLVAEIDEHKRAVEALDKSEERYRMLMQNLPVGVYRNTPGPQGEFLMANLTQAQMLGYESVDDFMQTTVAQHYVDPAERKLFSERLLARGSAIEELIRLKRRDGSILWAAVTAQVVRNADGAVQYVDGISEDVTERKQAEEKLAQQASELARSNAELERFAYAVSHDLQEPLRAVAGHCKLLQRRYYDKLDQGACELIEHAFDGATRMKELIDGLLAYSRAGSRTARIGQVDCETVLNTVLANLRTAIDDASAIIHRQPLPTVMADRSQLVALLQNLISNALKYRREAEPEIHIRAEPDDGGWVFAVRDNGIGIDVDHQKRIFAVFQRLHTREEYPGTGIGLAICKRIVEGLGGRMWVESEVGQGSTFFFTLPAEAPNR